MKILIEKGKFQFSEDGKTFKYNLLPVGKFLDNRYGWLDFTAERLKNLADRFDKKIPAYEIYVNEDHWNDIKVCSITNVEFVENEGLIVTCEIVNEEVFNKYDYLSAEIQPYADKTTGEPEEETLMGAAVTNRPANPFVEKIKLSENAEIEIVVGEEPKPPKTEEKKEEELGMTPEEIKKMQAENERLKKENADFEANQTKLSEDSKKARLEAKKAVWLSEGVAPATIEVAEKVILGENTETGKIKLSEDGKTVEMDLLGAIDKVITNFARVDLSEHGKGGSGGAGEKTLEEIAEEV